MTPDDSQAKAATPPPRFSVLVSTHKRPDGLKDLLTALRPQIEGRANRELIVVNDGTDGESYRAVVAAFAGMLTYHPLPNNVGVAAARNRAAALAKGDFIVFTDDDCVPPPWWLDWLQARLEFSPELDVVAGTTKPPKLAKPSFINRVRAHYYFIPHAWNANGMPMFVTANVAIRRSLFERLGGFGFAPDFPGAGEDTELSVRANRAMARISLDYEWYVEHETGGRWRDLLRRYWRYGYANACIARLPNAAALYYDWTNARRRNHFVNARIVFRELTERSTGFSTNPVARFASVVAAASVRVAHYDGLAVALKPATPKGPARYKPDR